MGMRGSLWGWCPTTPGKKADFGQFPPLVTPKPEGSAPHPGCEVLCLGACDLRSHLADSPNPVAPNCQLPTPMGSKCNPVGRRDGGLLGPHQLPQEEELCPQLGSSCRSRAVGPGKAAQVSTVELVHLTRLGLQAWPGTSCAGHWPGFSSGVPPE